MKQEIISLKKCRMNWWVERTKRFVQLINYIKHFSILASAITGYISISTFTSLLGIPLGITSSEIGLKMCVIAAGYKNYKPIIKKKKKKQNKIVLSAKTKLNSIEVLLSKALIDSNINHNKFVLISNELK